jgi:hypothetical protein
MVGNVDLRGHHVANEKDRPEPAAAAHEEAAGDAAGAAQPEPDAADVGPSGRPDTGAAAEAAAPREAPDRADAGAGAGDVDPTERHETPDAGVDRTDRSEPVPGGPEQPAQETVHGPAYGPSGWEQPSSAPGGWGPQGWGAPGPWQPGHGQPGPQVWAPGAPGHAQVPPSQPGHGQPYGQAYGVPGPGQPGYGPQPYGPTGYFPPQGPLGPVAQAPQPGVVPLRPLAVGDMLSGAVRYIRANPLLTLGASAAVMLVQLVLQLLLPVPDPFAFSSARPADVWFAAAGELLVALVALVLGAVLNALLFVVLSRAVLGLRTDAATAWRTAAPRVPGLVGLTVLVGLVVLAVVGIGAIPVVLAVVSGAADWGVLAFLLALAAVAVVVHLSVLWALAQAVYVLEPVGVVAAFGRSRRLVQGEWWRTFGVLLTAGLLFTIVTIAIVGVLGGFDSSAPTAAGLVRSAIGYAVAGTAGVPFTTGVVGLLYLDQRIRRERFDVELARAVAQAPPPR